MDDLATREFAEADPRLSLSRQTNAFVIDEVQLAPQLLPEVKRLVDEWRMSNGQSPEPSFWLTGSNQILAGRASYFRFHPLSVAELKRAGLAVQAENLMQFLSDYITTVIEKDVVLTAGIQKVREFTKTVRLLAGRSAQSLVVSNIAQDAGVKQPTIERMQIVSLVEPYYNDANRRLLRSPKLVFQDVGLAVRLQGWTEMAPLLVSPWWDRSSRRWSTWRSSGRPQPVDSTGRSITSATKRRKRSTFSSTAPTSPGSLWR